MLKAVGAASRYALSALALVLVLVFAGSTEARPPRDTIFDPQVLYFASCDNVAYGSDAPDQMTAQAGQSLTGLGGDDLLTAAEGTFCLSGGDGNDTLTADPANTRSDWLEGGPGADRLIGGPRADSLKGGPGNDRITGGAGNDVIDGGAGNDVIYGGAGNDVITGGSGHNTIFAGAGNDLISANDGSRERIDCGAGDDLVHADHGDRLVHCEHVKRRPSPYPQLTPRTGSFTTRFLVRYVAPYTTDIPANDEGTAGFDYQFVKTPSPSCHPLLTITSASPRDVVLGSHVADRFVIDPRGSHCRGAYTLALAYRNSSFGVECDSIAGAHPRRAGDLGDCPFTDVTDYFSLRIR